MQECMGDSQSKDQKSKPHKSATEKLKEEFKKIPDYKKTELMQKSKKALEQKPKRKNIEPNN